MALCTPIEGVRSVGPAALAVLMSVFGSVPCACAEDTLAFNEIAPHVYAHAGAVALPSSENRGDTSNFGFVVGDEAVAVIDAGGSLPVAREALAAIRRVTDKPVRYLILTHMHPDHVFGSRIFKDAGATIVGSAALGDALAARSDTYLASYRDQLGPALVEGVELLPPDRSVDGSLTLDLGHRALRLQTWPTAHTNTDLTVLDTTSGTLFAGDLVFLEHLPVIDGSLTGWLKDIESLKALPAARVVPGHGPSVAPFPAALEPEARYLETLKRDLDADIDAGIRLENAAASAAASEAANWQLFDAYNPRNATAAYAELEWQ
ncbi:quinoprotein relay system zinc metallohydrolase 2 [Aurantimonas sp. MSK8Z-1]|uniref:quinoprotein relay system zinc metallohydrolase 2 n=1 Tax=Mangrovibrevibacter kandeliae TaxID=2968473 RepID=UPI0021179047|nr:quinoprotein relay system zinc metallohydrolase 2 [Aurantimonas sp. MSK8Z-1]MCW4115615.1 quinoprotein relay system zinc metallohydrolase 2 [Aurantimonas sp. MSK8Z-1]